MQDWSGFIAYGVFLYWLTYSVLLDTGFTALQ